MLLNIQVIIEQFFSSFNYIAFIQIILIDLILSADNAIVIAMATKSLPNKKRNKAIYLGTAGAVILRICFALLIIYLFRIPYLHTFGGLLLLWIAYRLLVEKQRQRNISVQPNVCRAVLTIILADAIMSLDNVVAITGVAHGNLALIILGVAISIPIMIFGSKLIVSLLDRFSFVTYIGSGILAWTASEMIVSDSNLTRLLSLTNASLNLFVMFILTIIILLLGYIRSHSSE